FLAEPGHGAVEVVQVQLLGAVEGVVALPAVGGAVTAGGAQAVQDGEEDGAFDGGLEAALRQEVAEHVAAARPLPEAPEDEGRADAAGGDDGGLTVLVGGQHEGLLGEAGTGDEEGVELAGLLEEVEAAEGAEDALPGAAAVPEVLDELEVAAGAGR